MNTLSKNRESNRKHVYCVLIAMAVFLALLLAAGLAVIVIRHDLASRAATSSSLISSSTPASIVAPSTH